MIKMIKEYINAFQRLNKLAIRKETLELFMVEEIKVTLPGDIMLSKTFLKYTLINV